ncbi:MAG: hypothetical protein JWO80_1060 [Bryobacterales bacterium]|nr:hypothetical protein [Bryobacterales bacterium]
MGSHLTIRGIRFNDCYFSEPAHLGNWVQPKYAGLLGILVSDPNWAPKPFQPLYFGEFGNNAQVAALPSNYASLLCAASGRALLVCVYPMPFSTTAERWAVRNQLVWAYNPSCQADANKTSSGEHQEQSVQMKQLLTALEPSGEQKEPRRRIGFMPHCEPAL